MLAINLPTFFCCLNFTSAGTDVIDDPRHPSGKLGVFPYRCSTASPATFLSREELSVPLLIRNPPGLVS
jgi:hypothetical protein